MSVADVVGDILRAHFAARPENPPATIANERETKPQCEHTRKTTAGSGNILVAFATAMAREIHACGVVEVGPC